VTINDIAVNEQVREVHRASSRLDYLMREGKEFELFLELRAIEQAAETAMYRLNDLKRGIK
jgi:DNA-binding sugar fermentation-stimulating protein